MSAGTEKASAVLFEFMSAMKEWENKFAELIKDKSEADHLALFGQAKSELQPIYEKYLTKRDRKYGRLAGLSVGWPPAYDPDTETIVATQSVNDRKVVIETLWTHPTSVSSYTEKRRFTLICKHDEWRLDRKETFSYEGKWVKSIL
ncbi:MAG: hypothetical protein J2P54_13355 [Bradyrhizobiaceae bacterium]|nr:hypothetical protein [Bradyrhizobiaceae bacterium]